MDGLFYNPQRGSSPVEVRADPSSSAAARRGSALGGGSGAAARRALTIVDILTAWPIDFGD